MQSGRVPWRAAQRFPGAGPEGPPESWPHHMHMSGRSSEWRPPRQGKPVVAPPIATGMLHEEVILAAAPLWL